MAATRAAQRGGVDQGHGGQVHRPRQGRIASIIGRYYAMDRDTAGRRIQAAYDLITQGKAAYTAKSASEGLELAYARDESDEFVAATEIVPPGGAPVRILDGDVVVFMNFRSDRARQITRRSLRKTSMASSVRLWPRLGRFVSLTSTSPSSRPVCVPAGTPAQRARRVSAAHGIHQLRIAETEKYAARHVLLQRRAKRPRSSSRIASWCPHPRTCDLQQEAGDECAAGDRQAD